MSNIDRELARSSPGRETVLTIGVFDGVHRGHRHLLSRLKEEAVQASKLSGVLTFLNHPASVLRSDFKPSYLSSVDERLRLIRRTGVDFIVPLTFDLELSRVPAGEFVAMLWERLGMRGLLVGPDFALGRGREGDVARLISLGRQGGFSVTVVDPLLRDDRLPIRSTSVREALSQGDVTQAVVLLGRNFTLRGTVVRGVGRGGPMGFPTANIRVSPEVAIPGDGIYATWCHVGPRRYMAATSIGIRPTFDEGERTLEAFVMDFAGDLYGQEICLEFVRRLRDEAKFESAKALKEQIGRDVNQTRAVLSAGPS